MRRSFDSQLIGAYSETPLVGYDRASPSAIAELPGSRAPFDKPTPDKIGVAAFMPMKPHDGGWAVQRFICLFKGAQFFVLFWRENNLLSRNISHVSNLLLDTLVGGAEDFTKNFHAGVVFFEGAEAIRRERRFINSADVTCRLVYYFMKPQLHDLIKFIPSDLTNCVNLPKNRVSFETISADKIVIDAHDALADPRRPVQITAHDGAPGIEPTNVISCSAQYRRKAAS